MDLWDRLGGYPEVMLPLWGMTGQNRENDHSPRKKAGFWNNVLSEHAPLATQVESRTDAPPNILRAERLVSVAKQAATIAAEVGFDDLDPKIETYSKSPSGNIRGTREIIPPGDLQGKMEEVTPQMTLRPIPRVERIPEDELPLLAIEGITTKDANTSSESVREALASTQPDFTSTTNLEILLAHRKFHQRLLHRTQWSEHLGADIPSEEQGPGARGRTWVGWDPLLDPIPHADRAPGSGFLGDDDVPIPLE